ncbi:hypothetical protein SmJEL517_g04273 [Synchytrium microbalum]|uniref:Amine oxidase domain-containing protein n=1 Tax=Synchytrium microbalum TaxID=1806994 RepID=A0A507C0Q5_9FUNG|nr:uncharacterized protein SmJEL517_g04273 [Synchytrium microbalum]TPX32629.1 hypothetical protein SmJEL517_g04273 [Synchytrium microbalum]
MAQKIIVIGSGMSGLTAGGRIKTDTQYGVNIDMGASWIHGADGNPLTDLVPNARKVVFERIQMFKPDGKPISIERSRELLDVVRTAKETFWGVFERAANYVRSTHADMSMRDFIDQDEEWKRQLERDDLSREMLPFLEKAIENIEAADLETMSIREWDINDFGGEHCYLVDGYTELLKKSGEHILAEKDTRIFLNHVVTSIDYSGEKGADVINPVTVHTNQGDFSCAAVLTTIPLGYLKAHHQSIFNPPLPISKKQAIEGLGFGVLDKTILKFEKAFWPMDVEFFYGFVDNADPTQKPSLVSFLNVTRLHPELSDPPAILVAYYAQSTAMRMEGLTDKQVGEVFMTSIKRNFSDNVDEIKLVDLTVVRWACDPFALGSYSSIPVGQSGECNDALAAPLRLGGGVYTAPISTTNGHINGDINGHSGDSNGTLLPLLPNLTSPAIPTDPSNPTNNTNNPVVFFAGEATNRNHFATIHGALLSGRREANRMINLLAECKV